MGGVPDVMFVIDANKEELAIKEANVLGIPVVAVLDSNVSPDGISFPVPANDDAIHSIKMIVDLIATAVLEGKAEMEKRKLSAVVAKDEAVAKKAVVKAPAAKQREVVVQASL